MSMGAPNTCSSGGCSSQVPHQCQWHEAARGGGHLAPPAGPGGVGVLPRRACSPDEQTLDLNSEGLGEVSWEIAVGRKVLSGEGNSPDNTFLELHREGGSGGT